MAVIPARPRGKGASAGPSGRYQDRL
jgi:hypothetical protein